MLYKDTSVGDRRCGGLENENDTKSETSKDNRRGVSVVLLRMFDCVYGRSRDSTTDLLVFPTKRVIFQ